MCKPITDDEMNKIAEKVVERLTNKSAKWAARIVLAIVGLSFLGALKIIYSYLTQHVLIGWG